MISTLVVITVLAVILTVRFVIIPAMEAGEYPLGD